MGGWKTTDTRRWTGLQRASWALLAGLAGTLGCGGGKGEGTQPGECRDGIDNDDNGTIDCADPGCAGSPDCDPDDSGEPPDSGDSGDTGEPDPPGPDVPADWAAGFSWIAVPAGDFAMGATETELEDRADDEFPRTVTLTYDYEAAATEVPVALWATATGTEPDLTCGETCPATGLTWHAAAQVTVVLSEAAGLDPCYSCSGSGDATYCVPLGRPQWCAGYRLPTEAEWERAARADAGTVYAGSDDPGLVAWFDATSGGTLHPVGGLQANAWGGHDFSGNAWEWCHDIWMDMPSADLDELVDPIGATSGELRVVRGGSFDQPATAVRAANRESMAPTTADAAVGLRLVRTLDP